MEGKKSYTVKESFRYGGETYHPGDSIELTVSEAAALAGYLEGEWRSLQVSGDEEKLQDLLKELRGTIEAKDKELVALRGNLAAAEKKATGLEKGLAALKEKQAKKDQKEGDKA